MEVSKRKTAMKRQEAEWKRAFFLEIGVEPLDKDMIYDVKQVFLLKSSGIY